MLVRNPNLLVSWKGTRLSVTFGPSSGSADVAYLGFGDEKSISLGTAVIALQTLTKPVSR